MTTLTQAAGLQVAPQVLDQAAKLYQEQGYAKLERLFSAQEAGQIKEAMVEACELYDQLHEQEVAQHRQNGYQRVLDQKVNLWRISEAMRRVVLGPVVGEAMRRISGFERLRLFHDHALIKQPGDSRATPWHQDAPYWPLEQEGAFSIWIVLDDVDEENGCLSYIPATHRLGRLPEVDLINPRDIIKEHLKGHKPQDVKVMALKAGGAAFHHGSTFHYAGPNQSARPRHALAIIAFPEGTRYTGRPHVVTDGQGFGVGQPLEGELFPLLG